MIYDESSVIDTDEYATLIDFIVELSEAYGWDLTGDDEEAAWDFFDMNSHCHENTVVFEMGVCELDLEDFENVVVDSSNFIVSRIE